MGKFLVSRKVYFVGADYPTQERMHRSVQSKLVEPLIPGPTEESVAKPFLVG